MQSIALQRKVSAMSIRTEAEENLRIIRSLMEKATVYRAISAPGALVGGLCAVVTAVAGRWLANPVQVPPGFHFLVPWLTVLLIATVANFLLLAGGAKRRGETFLSPGMRLALRAMLPAMLGGGVVTLLILAVGPAFIASFWVLFYGISLLAASHFAPKSICWLGRAFFVAGVVLLGGGIEAFTIWERGSEVLAAHDIMGATFGLFHLVYAVLTWPSAGAAQAET
ncbi:MAG: hypothetical protein WCF18_20380 [Chthoniobacteraceae bacterium]